MIEMDTSQEGQGGSQPQPPAEPIKKEDIKVTRQPADPDASERPAIPDIEEALRGKLIADAEKDKGRPQYVNRASSIGDICERSLVYARTHYDQKPAAELGLQRAFHEGRLHERAFKKDLLDAGVDFVEPEMGFMDQQTKTSGHMDMAIPDGSTRWPLEFKSCASSTFNALAKYGRWDFMKAIPELVKRGKYWLSKYPGQVQMYGFFKAEQWAIVIFKNKDNGAYKQFNVRLDLLYVDQLLEKSKRVNAVVDQALEDKGAGQELDAKYCDAHYPERIKERSLYCKGCWFNHLCLPDIDFNAPLKIEQDPEFEEKLARWHSLKKAAAEYDKLNKELTGQCQGRENVMVGRFHVTGKKNVKGTWLKKIETIDEEEDQAQEVKTS